MVEGLLYKGLSQRFQLVRSLHGSAGRSGEDSSTVFEEATLSRWKSTTCQRSSASGCLVIMQLVLSSIDGNWLKKKTK